MIPELGQISLILSLLIALLLASMPLIGAHKNNAALMQTARPLAFAQLGFIVLTFLLLSYSFTVHDFSVAYVQRNSNSLLPLAYQLSAVWGAHEGSLLLWIMILCIWTAAVAIFSRQLPDKVISRVLAVMGMISVGFISFTLFTSDPFTRVFPVPTEGVDLNPLLQDPGLIFHPPLLYTGYVGFAVAFAFAIAALIDGKLDAQWIRWSRPWTNIAWAFLTLGIALGSFWAYYELGWGGWWFWDPVENASFMPWLVGAALIHSQAVTEKRGSFKSWTLLLAIAAFSLSLLGTFLVRSGVLTSVHAFASDPERGLFILAFLVIVIGGSLVLFALRAPGKDDSGQPFTAYSRETLLLLNNLLLTAAAFMVLIGTLYPLFADALQLGKISVGSPYFGFLFSLLMLPLALLLPFGPLTRWQTDQASKPMKLLAPWALLAIITGAINFFFWPESSFKTAGGVVAAVWILLATLVFVRSRLKNSGKRFTAEMIGMTSAHIGVGLFFFGVLMTESLSIEKDVAAKPNSSFSIRGYDFIFEGVKQVEGPNYIADRGTVLVRKGEQLVTTLHPEKRMYASGGNSMTEAAINSMPHRDLYVALGEPLDNEGTWALRLYVKPFIRFIWLGALLMAIGGFVVSFDKRFKRRHASEPNP
jgi:cytochrome c-type biogenesis protein CcmF